MDNTKQFNCISLCTGYAGLELGLRRNIPTMRTVAYVEIEAYAVANLVQKIEAGKLDAAPIWTDIKTFDGKPFRNRVHIITGGYPCQPFSVAGQRKGTEDPRHLWPYIERIIEAVRPVWCFFENVSGHLTIGFPEVYRSLRNLGYSVEAGLFTAAEVGTPHKRERLFILANSEQRWGRRPDGISTRQYRPLQTQGPGELADTCKQRPQGSRKERQGLAQVGLLDGKTTHPHRWPSRPGQPQYEWEEPRVVANPVSKRSRGKGGNAEHEGWETGKAGGKGLSQDTGREDGIAEPDDKSAGGNGASEGQTKQ